MRQPRTGPKRAIVVLGLLVLSGAGCAAFTDKDQQTEEQELVQRPEWRLGDRWVFQRTTLSGASAVVSHQIVLADQAGYTISILGLGAEETRRWTGDLHLVQETLAGGVTARYDPPTTYFAWPIGPGKTWSQEFQYTDGRNDGRYSNTWRIGATVEPIDTVAGRFYALRIERWSGPQRLQTYWYSPRVRHWVRFEDYLRGYVEELVEYRPWGSGAPR